MLEHILAMFLLYYHMLWNVTEPDLRIYNVIIQIYYERQEQE